MTDPLWLWAGFNVFILAMLALDLGVFHRKSHAVSLGVSVLMLAASVVWSLLFPKKRVHFTNSPGSETLRAGANPLKIV